MVTKLKYAAILGLGALLAGSTKADVIYNNLTPNNSIGMASRPDSAGAFEIETADDFVLTSSFSITSASFTGLMVGGTGGTPGVSDVAVEIYRVFPLDSNAARTPLVLTRANSPSDVAFESRDSGAAELTFGTTVLNSSFTANNSVQPGGIHAFPSQNTSGNGPVTGQEVQIDVTFLSPFDLPGNHYFFVPQVTLTNGAQFYWLSASRPISGLGTTPFPAGFTDLQVWTRDFFLDPDWSRVGADIVGGTTFNAAFSLAGTAVPEPASIGMVLGGLALLGFRARRKATR